MDPRWHPHNLHRTDDAETFAAADPTLRRLAHLRHVHESQLLDRLVELPPGIYTLGGGRQVGKTTLVKQLMQRLMEREGVAASDVAYVTGELIVDAEDFRQTLSDLTGAPERADGSRVCYIIVDEITYIRGWDRALKFQADAGLLENVVLLLTGSDLILMRDALTRLPGRRGSSATTDFRYHPLHFAAFCRLRGNVDGGTLETLSAGPPEAPMPDGMPGTPVELEQELRDYHRTGGYLTAINDLAQTGTISAATLRVYADWMRGDLIRRGRSETYLREILHAIATRLTSPVTWNALARELSIDHPKTVADYCALLERMDALLIVPALREDRLSAAPEKARKLHFTDPFIHHAAVLYLARRGAGTGPNRSPETKAPDPGSPADAVPALDDGQLSRLVEATVLAHVARSGPAFYIRAEGEVDAAYLRDGRFWPIGVTWATQLRPKDLKQVLKYPNAVIAGRGSRAHEISGTPVLPVPVVLLRLSRMADEVGTGDQP